MFLAFNHSAQHRQINHSFNSWLIFVRHLSRETVKPSLTPVSEMWGFPASISFYNFTLNILELEFWTVGGAKEAV